MALAIIERQGMNIQALSQCPVKQGKGVHTPGVNHYNGSGHHSIPVIAHRQAKRPAFIMDAHIVTAECQDEFASGQTGS
jgi:hypothetical protein